jgi:Zn-dependent M28 family amino/carboxypeptidase
VKLANISFLINLDLVGNGEEGITVVNATGFPSAFSLLQEINHSNQYISNIYSRGKARNSDHYWFTEKGVPSFFIYTMGKRKAYHDVDDVSSTLALPEVNDLELLITQFVDLWMKGQHAY